MSCPYIYYLQLSNHQISYGSFRPLTCINSCSKARMGLDESSAGCSVEQNETTIPNNSPTDDNGAAVCHATSDSRARFQEESFVPRTPTPDELVHLDKHPAPEIGLKTSLDTVCRPTSSATRQGHARESTLPACMETNAESPSYPLWEREATRARSVHTEELRVQQSTIEK